MASDNDNTNTINQRELWDESEPPLLRSEIEMAIKRLPKPNKIVARQNFFVKLTYIQSYLLLTTSILIVRILSTCLKKYIVESIFSIN